MRAYVYSLIFPQVHVCFCGALCLPLGFTSDFGFALFPAVATAGPIFENEISRGEEEMGKEFGWHKRTKKQNGAVLIESQATRLLILVVATIPPNTSHSVLLSMSSLTLQCNRGRAAFSELTIPYSGNVHASGMDLSVGTCKRPRVITLLLHFEFIPVR